MGDERGVNQEGNKELKKIDDFKVPSRCLYTKEVSLQWKKMSQMGKGLVNMGNTCFLNAALQCLLYTPTFGNYLMAKEHSASCRVRGTNAFCLLCQMEILFSDLKMKRTRPEAIVSNLRSVCRRFRLGRQEDSHEYIRCMLEAMQKNVLASFPEFV